MFSFYVFLFDLNFLQSIIPMLTKCYVSIMQYVLLDGFRYQFLPENVQTNCYPLLPL
jgi:hypothetical protein